MTPYEALRSALRRSEPLHRLNRRFRRFVPDLEIRRDIPHLGRTHFGLRRHQFLLQSNPLQSHARVLGIFERLVEPGAVFYDVGANIGYYARFTLRNLPIKRYIGFEPMESNLRILRKNVAEFHDAATLYPLALAETEGKEDLQIDDISGGTSVLNRISDHAPSESRRLLGLRGLTEQVACRRLEAVVAEDGLPDPTVLKIDTEGAEWIVVQGAGEMLERSRPNLAIALHEARPGRELLEYLNGIGYTLGGWLKNADGGEAFGTFTSKQMDRLADNNIAASASSSALAEPILPYDLGSVPRPERTSCDR